MSIPREFIELLLSKLDLVDVVNTQVPLRKKSGSNYFARCPFHNEKSASFSVSQTKQFYYCFGCGAHGNAIDFLMQHDRLSFPESIETLARQVGMEIPQSPDFIKKEDTSLALYHLLTDVTSYYYEQMRHATRAINYLKSRGVSGVIAQQFNLGYASAGWSLLLDQFGKTDTQKKKLLEAGLIIQKPDGTGYYDRFRDRIIFPIHDHRGRVIGFGGRIIDQGEPKYLNSPETPVFQKGHELYGLHQALKNNRHLDRVLIVEGYMDVIALFQYGITYAVATLGTATSSHHLKRLFRYTSEIIFCFDGDAAGRTAAWRALLVIFPLMHDSLQVRFLFLPEGEDPDSLIRKEGKSQFEKRYASGHTLSAFFFQTLSAQSDLNTMEGRARFASLALNHIKQLPEGIFRNLLIEALSQRARVDINSLKQQLMPNDDTQVKATNETTADTVSTVINKLPSAMKQAMAFLIQHPYLASLVSHPLSISNLPGYHMLSHIIDILQKNPEATTGALLEHWRGQKEEAFMAKLAYFDHMVPENGVKNEFLGVIRQLTMQACEIEIERLLAKAAQEDLTSAEKLELTNLIAKKKSLQTASS